MQMILTIHLWLCVPYLLLLYVAANTKEHILKHPSFVSSLKEKNTKYPLLIAHKSHHPLKNCENDIQNYNFTNKNSEPAFSAFHHESDSKDGSFMKQKPFESIKALIPWQFHLQKRAKMPNMTANRHRRKWTSDGSSFLRRRNINQSNDKNTGMKIQHKDKHRQIDKGYLHYSDKNEKSRNRRQTVLQMRPLYHRKMMNRKSDSTTDEQQNPHLKLTGEKFELSLQLSTNSSIKISNPVPDVFSISLTSSFNNTNNIEIERSRGRALEDMQPLHPSGGVISRETLSDQKYEDEDSYQIPMNRRETQRWSRNYVGTKIDSVDKIEELPVHKRTSVQYSSLVGPSFVNSTNHAKIHALAGQTARLNCDIRNLHNFTISWIRARDINLLTSAEVTYSSDNRFVAANPSRGDRWVLKIHHVRLSDAGKYLCQVSTSPPFSAAVTLFVTEAIGEVYPAREVFLKVGSPVRLICTIQGCPYPALPAWYKDRELQKSLIIEESAPTFLPADISTSTTTPSLTTEVSNQGTVTSARDEANYSLIFTSPNFEDYEDPRSSSSASSSTTSIAMKEVLMAKVIFEKPKATKDLSGNYSCTNTCTNPLNLTLHVLTARQPTKMKDEPPSSSNIKCGDEETAAMQHINTATTPQPLYNVYMVLLPVVYCVFYFTYRLQEHR